MPFGDKVTEKVCNEQVFSFDFTDALLLFCKPSPSNVVNFSFDFTEPLARRKPNVEPSTLTRRALGVSITSARHFDNERSATS